MRLVFALALSTALLAVSCGIPLDDDPQVLALPEENEAETTTTTSLPEPGEGQTKTLYFIKEGLLVTVQRELAEPVSNQSVFDALTAGPTEQELESGIESRLTETFDSRVVLSNEVLTVDILNEGGLDFEGDQRILAIAQIVFTATVSTGAAAGVRFQEAGEFVQETNGAGELQELGEDGIPVPLRTVDFDDLRPSLDS